MQSGTLVDVTGALPALSRRPDWSVDGASIFIDLFSNISCPGGGSCRGYYGDVAT